MPYNGYLDANDGWSVSGWAFDARRPNEPVEVEISLASGFVGTVVANQFRADLVARGFGDGRHAFGFRLPDGAGEGDVITARIKGNGFVLKGSPMSCNRRAVIDLVAADIVNNCNLRCPFCLVDYANVRGLKLMSRATFAKAIELMPGLPRGSFWLSCLHEPTLHPQFIEMVEAVPAALRDRISFTTNLSKRMPDDFFGRLARSGVDHIRISFDSREPAVFAELRKGAKFEVFEQNLRRLVAELASSPRAPRLHLITVALKENHRDLPALIEYCRKEFGARSHEVRFPYYLPHLAQWGRDHVLTQGEWNELERALQPLAAVTELTVCGPQPAAVGLFAWPEKLLFYVGPETHFGESDDLMQLEPPDPREVAAGLGDETLNLRLRWDGYTDFTSEPFRLNINRLEQPARYFEAIRAETKFRQQAIAPATARAI